MNVGASFLLRLHCARIVPTLCQAFLKICVAAASLVHKGQYPFTKITFKLAAAGSVENSKASMSITDGTWKEFPIACNRAEVWSCPSFGWQNVPAQICVGLRRWSSARRFGSGSGLRRRGTRWPSPLQRSRTTRRGGALSAVSCKLEFDFVEFAKLPPHSCKRWLRVMPRPYMHVHSRTSFPTRAGAGLRAAKPFNEALQVVNRL